MKKATTTLREFAESLRTVAADIYDVARFDLDYRSLEGWPRKALAADEFFSFGKPQATASFERGERVSVHVGWLWWPGPVSEERGAALIVSRLRSVRGVEDVEELGVDSQLGVVWGVLVTIRPSQ